jgi:uncharacterized membrane protein
MTNVSLVVLSGCIVPLIDERILIAAPTDVVWAYLSDPTLLIKWHRGCKTLSILSTSATGIGARRRCVDDAGHTSIEEITAWLANIGYEYKAIEGPYRDLRGRFRLQSVPDGTMVNWTIEYSPGGVLGGISSAVRGQHVMRNRMAESLKALQKVIRSSGRTRRADPAGTQQTACAR